MFIFLLSVQLSCVDDPIYQVEGAFDIYVEQFIEEGNERGLDFDFHRTGLTIQFASNITGSPGACLGNRQIVINREDWALMDEFEKESLIFHELGHCELDRAHDNQKLKNGEWTSIMRGTPFSACDNDIINYAGTRREYYLDELFGVSQIDEPPWSQLQATLAKKNQKQSVWGRQEAIEFIDSIEGLSSSNFEIDLELNTDEMEGFGGFQFTGISLSNNIRIFTNSQRDLAIDSGKEVWGFMHLAQKNHLLKEGFNRITVQRLDNRYHIFINGTFFYWFDFIQPRSNIIASANIGDKGKPIFRNLSVSILSE